MPRAILTLVLTLSLLAPHRFCTCARAAAPKPQVSAPTGCPCKSGHVDGDAPSTFTDRPSDRTPPSPAVPPCGGHESYCLAFQAPERKAGDSAGSSVQVLAEGDAHPWRHASPALAPRGGAPPGPLGGSIRPLYLSQRTLLI
jgi:hypothetical protein